MSSEPSTRNELSVRAPGEFVSRVLVDTGSPQHRDLDQIVLLIHGYQNSETKARRAFERFETGLRTMAGAAMRDVGIWDFQWPGSHPVWPISVATYSNKVGAAELSAERLVRQWLALLRPDQSVYIVAHSLGCRVAMAAMQTIAEMYEEPAGYPGARVRKVFLLAAAVPVRLCVPGRTFGAAVDASRQYVFHSRSDRVLQDPG